LTKSHSIVYRQYTMKALDRDTASMYASWFRALADSTRLLVLSFLATSRKPRSVREIVDALDVGQATVSQHLKVLKEACFVVVKEEGTRRMYSLNPRCLEQFPTAAAVVMGKVDQIPVPEVVRPPWADTQSASA
jgi:ArsR family transcriptional regulator, arsenate/arsenite/antimonite-responsive transcriptional repressor